MSYPPKPDIQTSYTAIEQALGDGTLPGQELDVDLANLKSAIDALNDFVRGLTRSDGRLGNNTVTRDTLATDILLGLEPPGAWQSGKDYRPPNTVFEDNRFYLALTEHTSSNFQTDLAAGRWLLLADFSIGDPVPLARQVNTSGLATGGGDLTENRTIDVPAASQAEAEAGTANDKAMTPLRVAQALAALRAFATQAQAEAGTNNDTVMTPLRVAQAIAEQVVIPDPPPPPDSIPAGSVVYVARNTAPDGYLKANGAAVSRSTYSDLFSAIGTTFGSGDGSTTFNLPDLRGEFIRGWDDGRNVDSGRSFGSAQADEFRSHNHSVSGRNSTDGVLRDFRRGGTNGSASTRNTGSEGGDETRPRNVALLAIIKY